MHFGWLVFSACVGQSGAASSTFVWLRHRPAVGRLRPKSGPFGSHKCLSVCVSASARRRTNHRSAPPALQCQPPTCIFDKSPIRDASHTQHTRVASMWGTVRCHGQRSGVCANGPGNRATIGANRSNSRETSCVRGPDRRSQAIAATGWCPAISVSCQALHKASTSPSVNPDTETFCRKPVISSARYQSTQ